MGPGHGQPRADLPHRHLPGLPQRQGVAQRGADPGGETAAAAASIVRAAAVLAERPAGVGRGKWRQRALRVAECRGGGPAGGEVDWGCWVENYGIVFFTCIRFYFRCSSVVKNLLNEYERQDWLNVHGFENSWMNFNFPLLLAFRQHNRVIFHSVFNYQLHLAYSLFYSEFFEKDFGQHTCMLWCVSISDGFILIFEVWYKTLCLIIIKELIAYLKLSEVPVRFKSRFEIKTFICAIPHAFLCSNAGNGQWASADFSSPSQKRQIRRKKRPRSLPFRSKASFSSSRVIRSQLVALPPFLIVQHQIPIPVPLFDIFVKFCYQWVNWFWWKFCRISINAFLLDSILLRKYFLCWFHL